ncbi:LysR family transcriptional regulator [Pseudomonas syringae pv. coriandricola]|uniref:LysR family transcriptional regulator n=1 Tax=Pseudomonas syringae pv. coriandricola TaxID=264453 RepID=A0A0P9LJM3_9PSED|nr:LysR family transcriptional regulator [Pseudomonas syringae pv. coriandricola]RMN13392.1 LysR family transcriptional regulator [Pseudomonas syringae pv. coriandricola]
MGFVARIQRKRRVQIVQQFMDWLASEQALSGVSLAGRPLPSIAV